MTTGHELLELEAANALVEIDVQLPQCCRRGCKNSDVAPQCIAEGCNKHIHYACYEGMVLQKHGYEPLDNDVPEDERDPNVVVCTKTHAIKRQRKPATVQQLCFGTRTDGRVLMTPFTWKPFI